ncbi:hypothetical protein FOA52_004121 [Chlamydomonas sp. UWO 241]|nr:hypothetical protein FOA52_004121 [Chlamydomonas sp. UWO 241]
MVHVRPLGCFLLATVAVCALLVCALPTRADDAEAKAAAASSKISEKVAGLIQKKKHDQFLKELTSSGVDVNQPTPGGQLLLVEAVKSKKIEFVDPLIQYHASINVKEAGTGASPIMLAFQNNLVPIAKMLLAYGADPEVAANNGKKASDVMASGAITALYAEWEKDGAMAFEDAPGSWVKSTDDSNDGAVYWSRRDGKEGRWNMPPNAAWQRVEHKDAPPSYVNFVTGQAVHARPPSLSWVKLNAGEKGQQMWYNWAVNITQLEEPQEMPRDMIVTAEAAVNRRWYNEKTGAFSWEEPSAAAPWRKVRNADAPEGEQTFFYNLKTGDSQWDLPEELAWVQDDSHESGTPFWYNTKTDESTWDKPHHHAWVMQEDDL